MRKLLEEYLVWLKVDMQISAKCGEVLNNLLTSLTTDSLFAEELSVKFKGGKAVLPYEISDKDPTQVALLKKTLNALFHAEHAFQMLETIDISSDRFTADIIFDVVFLGLVDAVDELYEAVQLVNHSGVDVQNIIGPHIASLLPKLGVISESFSQFTPKNLGQVSAKKLAAAVSQLPSEKHTARQGLANFSDFIFALPNYLEELQRLIATGDSGIIVKSTTSAPEFQAEMLRRANKTKEYFETLATKNYLWVWPSYFSTLKTLAKHSSDLLSTTSQLSKQAYQDAEAQLNKIRHEILPQLVAELESVEESMGLNTNILAGPAIEKMESYYSQLSTYVDGIVTQFNNAPENYIEQMDDGFFKRKSLAVLNAVRGDTSEKLTTTPGLNVMRDEGFMANLLERQSKRLVQADLESRDDSKLDAAKRFFEKLETYTPEFHLWSLANIPSIEKEALLMEYKQIQSHFAAVRPDIDKLIVNTLTKRSPSGLLTGIYNSEYKQIYAADHFTQVLVCKDAVIIDIKQALAQAAFKAQLIQKNMEQREAIFYEAQKKTTHFNPDVKPFVPLVVAVETSTAAEPSSDVYHQKSVATGIQLHQLYLAKDGLNAFFNRLRDKYQHNPKISELSADDKAFLQRAYKQFQPHVLVQDQGLLNIRLLSALTSEKSDRTLGVRDLLPMKEEVSFKLNALISKSIQDQKDYTEQEKATKMNELRTTPITAMGAQLEKKTLFGRIVTLKLSKNMDNFIKGQLLQMLKEKLDPDVFKQLSIDKLPFVDLHKDSQDVVMYKQLINSLYYVQQSLARLEKAEDGYYIFERVQYIRSLLKVVSSIVDAKDMLANTTKNPGIAVIINKVQQILQPLQNIPMIGEYLRASPATAQPVPEQDILAAWLEQLEILDRALSADAFVAVKPVEQVLPNPPRSVAPVGEADYLRLIAEQLYRIPQSLRAFNPDIPRAGNEATLKAKIKEEEKAINAKIKAFVDRLSGLSIGPGSLQNILLSVIAANTQLSHIGKESRALAMSVLPATMGKTMVLMADSAELQLGLKPGTLSTSVNDQFNAFYSTLISHLPFKKDQADLRRLTSIDLVEARIKNVESQRMLLLVNEDAKVVEASIFGGTYTVDLMYKELDVIAARDPLIKDELVAVYDKLSRYLPNKDGVAQFRESLILIDDQLLLRQMVTDLKDAKEHVDDPLGSFEKLSALFYMHGDFSKVEDQEKCLKGYQALQPFLQQIDYHYNLSSFLRRLDSPAGFEKVLKEIIDLEPKLRELVAGKVQENIGKLQQCGRQLVYLNAVREQEILAAEIGIDKFKDMVFSNYLQANVRSQLEKALGPDSEAFFTKISAEIIAQKDDILRGITIAQDIEAVIGTNIDAVQGKIMKEHLTIKIDYEIFADMQSLRDKIIKITLLLQDMQMDVSKQSDVGSPVCQAKLAEIDALLTILNSTESPYLRLQDLKNRGMGNACKDILLKSSDNIFVRFLKSLWSFISGWQRKEVRSVASFQELLKDIKDYASEIIGIRPAPPSLARPPVTPAPSPEPAPEAVDEQFFDAVTGDDDDDDDDDDEFQECNEHNIDNPRP